MMSAASTKHMTPATMRARRKGLTSFGGPVMTNDAADDHDDCAVDDEVDGDGRDHPRDEPEQPVGGHGVEPTIDVYVSSHWPNTPMRGLDDPCGLTMMPAALAVNAESGALAVTNSMYVSPSNEYCMS